MFDGCVLGNYLLVIVDSINFVCNVFKFNSKYFELMWVIQEVEYLCNLMEKELKVVILKNCCVILKGVIEVVCLFLVFDWLLNGLQFLQFELEIV